MTWNGKWSGIVNLSRRRKSFSGKKGKEKGRRGRSEENGAV